MEAEGERSIVVIVAGVVGWGSSSARVSTRRDAGRRIVVVVEGVEQGTRSGSGHSFVRYCAKNKRK